MPLYLALVAVLLGVVTEVSAFGRDWTLSFLDGVGVGVASGGAAVAWRRRSLRVDAAWLGYLGLLAVIAAQAVLRADPAATVGGSSRFVTALLLLFGLTQLAPTDGEAWDERWRWPFAFALFGGVLAVWVIVPFLDALADPTITTFYDVKNAVVTPLGASNYLAAFLLVAFVVTIVHAVERNLRWMWLAALTLSGLLATMSRGAVGAALVVLLGLAIAWRERHAVVRTVAAVGVAAVAFGLVAVAAAGLASSDDVDLAIPELRQSPAAEPAVSGRGAGARATPPASGLEQLDGVLSQIAIGGRRQLYRASWEAFTDHPVIGVGVNRLATYSGRGGHPPHVNAHNLTLHALATTGLLGTLSYLAVWLVLAWRLWHLPAGTGRTALLAGMAALLLHAQVEALSHTRAVEALLVIVLALTAASPDARGVRTLPLHRRPGRAVAADAGGRVDAHG